MIGSHNTMTFLPPTKWWMYLLNWTAKCQNKPVIEQIDAGAKVLDFRIKCTKDRCCFSHGLIDYEDRVDPYTAIQGYIQYGITKGLAQVRIMAEDTCVKSFDYSTFTNITDKLFVEFHDKVNLIIVYSKKNGGALGSTKYVEYEDYYKFSWSKFIPFPWLYAKLFIPNIDFAESESILPNKYLILRDFI